MNVVCVQVEFLASDYSSGEVLQRVLCLSDTSKLHKKGGHDRNTGRSATVKKKNIIDALNVK